MKCPYRAPPLSAGAGNGNTPTKRRQCPPSTSPSDQGAVIAVRMRSKHTGALTAIAGTCHTATSRTGSGAVRSAGSGRRSSATLGNQWGGAAMIDPTPPRRPAAAPPPRARNGDWSATVMDDGRPWIPWDDATSAPRGMVEFITRSRMISAGNAGDYRWGHVGNDNDIMAWRPAVGSEATAPARDPERLRNMVTIAAALVATRPWADMGFYRNSIALEAAEILKELEKQ